MTLGGAFSVTILTILARIIVTCDGWCRTDLLLLLCEKERPIENVEFVGSSLQSRLNVRLVHLLCRLTIKDVHRGANEADDDRANVAADKVVAKVVENVHLGGSLVVAVVVDGARAPAQNADHRIDGSEDGGLVEGRRRFGGESAVRGERHFGFTFEAAFSIVLTGGDFVTGEVVRKDELRKAVVDALKVVESISVHQLLGHLVLEVGRGNVFWVIFFLQFAAA